MGGPESSISVVGSHVIGNATFYVQGKTEIAQLNSRRRNNDAKAVRSRYYVTAATSIALITIVMNSYALPFDSTHA